MCLPCDLFAAKEVPVIHGLKKRVVLNLLDLYYPFKNRHILEVKSNSARDPNLMVGST